MKLAYLGPEGSYSYLAAKKYAELTGVEELIACQDFESVFDAVAADTEAIVPIENSIEGSVNNNLDLLVQKNVYIIKELTLDIEHRLFLADGAELSDVLRIASHPQALAQCRRSLKNLLPDAETLLTSSTSRALELLDNETAAVASAQNAKEGVTMLETNISDCKDNRTRFLVLSGECAPIDADKKISIVFEAENKPGGLLKKLLILDDYNLNMTKIESRPHKSELGRYVFFVDFQGAKKCADILRALALIEKSSPFYKFLGCC